jgi:tRNA(fMet)-specific endonuclease VapC
VAYLLDTNIVTYLLKRNATVDQKLRDIRTSGKQVFISCITFYEIKRGLLAINATKQLSEFNRFCQNYKVLLLDDMEILEKACEIHADLKKKGTPIQEADILIAATAITRGLIVVSNDSDMLRVSEISLENWL